MVSEGRAGWRTGLKDLRGKPSRASKHIAQGCFDKTNKELIAMEIFQQKKKKPGKSGDSKKANRGGIGRHLIYSCSAR